MEGARKQKQIGFFLRHLLQTLGALLLVAIVIRTFFVSSYAMSGASMLPSVWPGDFMIGYKWGLRQVRRGDVVVLRCPPTGEEICLKRVVAIEGDRVEIESGRLVVNGQGSTIKAISSEFSVEGVEGRQWAIWPDSSSTEVSEPLVVPPRHVYLLNDKRQIREDSRSFGPVPLPQIEARVARVWLSLDWYDGESVRPWPRVRWKRLMRRVD